MTNFVEIYADASRGQYIPKFFADSIREDCVSCVTQEQFAALCDGPDNESYWDTWESVLNNAVIRDSAGNEWTLYQDGDLFMVRKDCPDHLAPWFEG